jgi:hypothetical protein
LRRERGRRCRIADEVQRWSQIFPTPCVWIEPEDATHPSLDQRRRIRLLQDLRPDRGEPAW